MHHDVLGIVEIWLYQRLESGPYQRLPLPGPEDDGVDDEENWFCLHLEFAHYQRVLLPSPVKDVLEIELCQIFGSQTCSECWDWTVLAAAGGGPPPLSLMRPHCRSAKSPPDNPSQAPSRSGLYHCRDQYPKQEIKL